MKLVFIACLSFSYCYTATFHQGVRYTTQAIRVFDFENGKFSKKSNNGKDLILEKNTAVIPCIPLSKDSKPIVQLFDKMQSDPELPYKKIDDKKTLYVGYTLVENIQTPVKLVNLDGKSEVKQWIKSDKLKQYKEDLISQIQVSNHHCSEFYNGNYVDLEYLGRNHKPSKLILNNQYDRLNSEATKIKAQYNLKADDHYSIVEKFHQSEYCTKMADSYLYLLNKEESIKTDYLDSQYPNIRNKKYYSYLLEEHWNSFIKNNKDKLEPNKMQQAMALDISARTTLFESNPDLNCLNKGICEKRLILLTIKNRSLAKKNRWKQYGVNNTGDIAGAALNPKQFHIWLNKNIVKKHLLTCFLNDSVPTSKEEDGSNKLLEFTLKHYIRTLIEAKNILLAKDLDLFFNLENPKENIQNLTLYYHPLGMRQCTEKSANLFLQEENKFIKETRVNEFKHNVAFIKNEDNYFISRFEKVLLPKKNMDSKIEVPYSTLIISLPKEKTYDIISNQYTAQTPYGKNSMIEKRFLEAIYQPKTRSSRPCLSYGVIGDKKNCSSLSKLAYKYYRTAPNWSKHATQLTCKQSPSFGSQCDLKTKSKKNVFLNGNCDRLVVPALDI